MNKVTKWLVGAICALTVVFSSSAAITQPDDSWTFTLGGAGATTTSGNSQTAFGVDLGVGHTGKVLLPVEFGVRQNVSYDSDAGNANFDTRVFTDWTLLSFYKFDIFAGGNVGLTYGDVSAFWTIAPEAGVRFYLKKDVAVVGRLDYPYDLSEGRWNDTLRYTVGLRVSF